MTPSPSSILRSAADLIEPEGAWTQGAWARTKTGKITDESSRYAVCFCISGAINRVDKARPWLAKRAFFDITGRSVIAWNDKEGRTQAEVVAKLREVADKLDAEASSPSRDHDPSAGDPLDGGAPQ